MTLKELNLPHSLYHATPIENIPSILKNGLLPEYAGRHGSTEISYVLPGAIYLSRKPDSDNLNIELEHRELAIVRVETSSLMSLGGLRMDDFGVEFLLENTNSKQDLISWLGLSESQSSDLFNSITSSKDDEINSWAEDYWQAWLKAPLGGEVACVNPIPPALLKGVRRRSQPLSAENASKAVHKNKG